MPQPPILRERGGGRRKCLPPNEFSVTAASSAPVPHQDNLCRIMRRRQSRFGNFQHNSTFHTLAEEIAPVLINTFYTAGSMIGICRAAAGTIQARPTAFALRPRHTHCTVQYGSLSEVSVMPFHTSPIAYWGSPTN